MAPADDCAPLLVNEQEMMKERVLLSKKKTPPALDA